MVPSAQPKENAMTKELLCRVFEALIDAGQHELAGDVWDLWPELA
jgi:hypothetical protein